MDSLQEIQAWYARHCDGDWEHAFGIKISNIDNPGWRVMIDLRDTELDGRSFDRIAVERSKDDWLRCWVEKRVFHAACGPHNLDQALRSFLDFAAVKS